jgi:hypothetical protein
MVPTAAQPTAQSTVRNVTSSADRFEDALTAEPIELGG